ncbi:MAG: HEAT repeat domain-containing protein [Elusimicrobiota bacterium]
MRKREKTSGNPRFLACWALAGALEAPVCSLLLRGEPLVGYPVLALGHVAAAVLVFFAVPKGAGWLSPKRGWAEPMALWTLLMPGFGWLFAGVLRFSYDSSAQRKDFSPEEDLPASEDEEFLRALGLEGGRPGEEQRLREASEIMPATDILLGTDPTLKRSAIETLARIRTPEAIGWLLQARTDPAPEVRFHATSSLTYLKRDYEQRIRAAEREVFDKPADIRPQLALRHITYEYALSGLVDHERRRELLKGCREPLLELAEREVEALHLLARIEAELDPERALVLLDRLVERSPEGKDRWLRAQAALLFRLGRYDEVKKRIDELRAEPGGAPAVAALEDAEWKSVLLWWGEE